MRDIFGKVTNAKHFYLLLPVPLIVVPALWVLAYYLRIHETQAAYIVNVGLRVGLAAFFCALAIGLVATEKRGAPVQLILFAVPLFFAVCLCAVFAAHGFDPILKQVAGQFFLNALPAFVVGVYCAKYRKGLDLLRGLEACGLVFVPAALIYIGRLFVFPDQYWELGLSNLGRLTYMSFAYGLMPVIAASCLLLVNEQVPKSGWRWCVIFIYWLALTLTQTKGAVLGFLLFLIALVICNFKGNKRPAITLLIACVMCFVFSVAVLPRVLGASNDRFSTEHIGGAIGFTGGAPKVTSLSGREFLQENEGNGVAIYRTTGECVVQSKEIAKRIALDETLREALRRSSCAIRLTRPALLTVSLEEIKNQPWFGMGPMGFQFRYFGIYPHNIAIELLVELGVLFGGAVLAVLCYWAYALFQAAREVKSHRLILLFSVSYIPMFLVSGSLWGDMAFLFCLGYAAAVACASGRAGTSVPAPEVMSR